MPEPESILTFEDHATVRASEAMHLNNGLLPNACALRGPSRLRARVYGLKDHGYPPASEGYDGGSQGISHALMAERYARPDRSSSAPIRTRRIAAHWVVPAFGIGTTDMANAMMTGVVRVTVPLSLCGA